MFSEISNIEYLNRSHVDLIFGIMDDFSIEEGARDGRFQETHW